MALRVLKQVRSAFRTLDPRDIRESAERSITVGLIAGDEATCQEMERFLAPAASSGPAARHVIRIERANEFECCHIGFTDARLDGVPHFHVFDPHDPEAAIKAALDHHHDLWLPLARSFVAFRRPVAEKLIYRVAFENAAFAMASALPNVIPNLFELPWAVGEFASDTVVLTMNQVRLAISIAAAYGEPAGYFEQRGQIASIVTSAFGWRAIARELVSKIPFGGGLAQKGLVAFTGTYTVGLALERYLRLGREWTSHERQTERSRVLELGRAAVAPLLKRVVAGGSRG